MAEVGKLEAPKIQGKYDTGQMFLHRVFGYRGVILFPWHARVYDRDLVNSATVDAERLEENNGSNVGKEVRGRTQTFYQVLIDSRDCPFIVSDFIVSIVYDQFLITNLLASANRGCYLPW